MDVVIAAIGNQKQSPELEMLSRYVKQTRWKVTVREFEDKRSVSAKERMQKEGALLLSAVPEGGVTVALDGRGKLFTSVEFAEKMGQWQDGGVPAVAFLLGGADGHSPEVREIADLLLAFGKMTWPHMLARVMLAEQIYRAKTILDGHPYHRN